jgi:hypothetical protein
MGLVTAHEACSSQTKQLPTAQEIIMARKPWLPGSAAVFALTALAATAQAGPVGGSARELAAAGMTGSQLQQIANRVCWSQNGMRRCRSLNNVRVYGYQAPRYRARAVGYGYQAPAFYGVGPPIGYGGFGYRDQIEIDPNAFPVGSEGWWNSMDALDRGGQGNGSAGQ